MAYRWNGRLDVEHGLLTDIRVLHSESAFPVLGFSSPSSWINQPKENRTTGRVDPNAHVISPGRTWHIHPIVHGRRIEGVRPGLQPPSNVIRRPADHCLVWIVRNSQQRQDWRNC